MVYWLVTAVLIGFGILAALSIGLPFLTMGLAMLLLAPLRRRALVIRPIIAGLVAGNVAFWLTAPFECTASSSPVGGSSAVTCSSLTGIPWPSDASGMNVAPSAFGISAVVALLVAVVVAALVFSWLWMDRERRGRSARTQAPST
jgi:hypothetical protein